MVRKKENYEIKSVQRAIKVLRAFTRTNKRLTLTEIHSITKIGISSLQRLLYTLTTEGLLERNEDDKRYGLGLDFLFFAELVKKNSVLLSIAQPVMESIHESTSESISLNIVEGNQRKCIAAIDSQFELTALTFTGQQSPLYAGASAKVLLANFSHKQLMDYLKHNSLDTITDNTVVEKDKLLKELQKIKDEGFAVSYGERVKGANSISAPIFDPFKQIVAGISITIPTVRFEEYDLQTLINQVVDAGDEITNKMLSET